MLSDESDDEKSNTVVMKNMLSGSGYSDKAIQYFIEKPYIGAIPDADQISELTGTCGDTMRICLKVGNGIILDARYQVLGCPGAIASAMAVVDLIKGKKIEDACTLNDGDVFRLLEDIPAQKNHCIELAVKTLHKALDDYMKQSNR